MALEESDRLWFVGARALADNILPLGVQILDQFVQNFPNDPRVPEALMMIGRTRLTLGDTERALDAFRRAAKASPPPGIPFEARFWEAETLVRLERYAEARTAYDEVVKKNRSAPFAPDALYGYGWTELVLTRPEPAVAALRDFVKTWPDHRLASSATYQLGRALVELKQYDEVVPVLTDFARKYPEFKFVADAQYLLGWSRIRSGDVKGGMTDLKAFVAKYPSHALAADAKKLVTEAAVRAGDKSDLADAYVALMKETPPTPEGLLEAASVAAKLGRPRDQELAWKKLQTEFPEHPYTLKLAFEFAATAFKKKEWGRAAMFAETAARTDDEAMRAEAWLLAGEAELKLKKFAAAAKALQAVSGVVKIDGNVRYRALAALGLAHEGQRDLKAALDVYESVARSSPDPALRDWARERADALKVRLDQPPATVAPTIRRSSS